MFLKRDGTFVRTDIWREGEYLDLWSVPHFLSGMGVGFTLFFLRFDTVAAFVIAFLLLVAYEMFEVIAHIEETRWNRILDVVVGMVSFAPTYLLAPILETSVALSVFAVVLMLDGVLSFFGWSASQKAAVLEAALRVEFEKERTKLRMRRGALKVSLQNRRRRWRERRIERRMHPDREAFRE